MRVGNHHYAHSMILIQSSNGAGANEHSNSLGVILQTWIRDSSINYAINLHVLPCIVAGYLLLSLSARPEISLSSCRCRALTPDRGPQAHPEPSAAPAIRPSWVCDSPLAPRAR